MHATLNERRSETRLFRDLMMPVIVSVVTGVGASYITMHIALSVLETQVNYIQREVEAFQTLVEAVNTIQVELSTRSQVDTMTERQINNIFSELNTKQTKDDARRDYELLLKEIQLQNIHTPPRQF